MCFFGHVTIQDSISTLSTEVINENESIDSKPSSSYGTLKFSTPDVKLTYTWTNIDVFGEVQKNVTASNIGFTLYPLVLVSKVRSYFSRGYQHIPRPRKHLLENVSGIALPGELLAVLGSSGAGKTTLLNSLAFRSPSGVQISHAAVRALNGKCQK